MKIFIAGARAISCIDSEVAAKLFSISEKGYDVLVGDASGVDSAVQFFYEDIGYKKVTVFACNGKARNNHGKWDVEAIPANDALKGFDFYKQKDIAMAHAADYGFMIWDGESKGTLNNIFNLIDQNKTCLVYLNTHKKFFVIDNQAKGATLFSLCSDSTKATMKKLNKIRSKHMQIAMF